MELIEIIKDFQVAADKAVKIFQKKYNVDYILDGWHMGQYEQVGNLKEEGLNFYAFHGIGVAAHFDDLAINFDFAEFPEPRHDGFDLSRLKSFINSQTEKYPEFIKSEELEQEFNLLVSLGVISRPKLLNSTTLYFLSDSLPKHIQIEK